MTAPLFFFVLLAAACDSAAPSPARAAAEPASPGAVPSGDLPDDRVVASWDGGQITYGEVVQGVRMDLARMEAEYLQQRHELLSSALEEALLRQLLEDEAKARGLDGIDALLKAEVEAKVAAPTEEEVQGFYDSMRPRLGGAPLEAVRAQLVDQLTRRKQAERFRAYVDELKERHGVTVDLPLPEMPRIEVSVDDDPARGPEAAKVTIIEFADYQCPYCRRAESTLEQVRQAYPDEVRFVFRDFPLSFHDRAMDAAVAANCAGEQGKYWEMHDLLMDPSAALDDASLEAYAKRAGVNVKKWKQCVDADREKQEAEIRADMAAGEQAGVQGTPAFFINGIVVSGAQPFEAFKRVIDRELGRAGAQAAAR